MAAGEQIPCGCLVIETTLSKPLSEKDRFLTQFVPTHIRLTLRYLRAGHIVL